MRTGSIIPVHKAIGSDYDQAMALRMELGEARARSEPLYVCPLCGTRVVSSSYLRYGRCDFMDIITFICFSMCYNYFGLSACHIILR